MANVKIITCLRDAAVDLISIAIRASHQMLNVGSWLLGNLSLGYWLPCLCCKQLDLVARQHIVPGHQSASLFFFFPLLAIGLGDLQMACSFVHSSDSKKMATTHSGDERH